MEGEPKGLIFDIQGFSVHDGPGCRTLIFLKGCPLHCPWCSNPEGRLPYPNLMYHRDACMSDFACVAACPFDAISINDDGPGISIERSHCRNCREMPCVAACDYKALEVSGRFVSVDELMELVNRDRNYYGEDGGVTLSGGEPLLQLPFVKEFLRRCADTYVHTAIETTGHVPWESFEQILENVDWIFYDLKTMDDAMHRRQTGVSNGLILRNAQRLAHAADHYRLIFRLPLIPGINDSAENLERTARFVRSLGKDEINILPLHHLGSSKYELLGLGYGAGHLESPDKTQLERAKAILESHSLRCYVGSETPF